MQVGVLKEIKRKENRVAMTPAGVEQMISRGHKILMETTAGEGSGFSDEDYEKAGAAIAATPKEVYDSCEMVMKVKEPLPVEYDMIREDQIVFTYFHFAASEELTRAMMKDKCVAIAYETVEKANGSLPLLTPMSEVAGRMAIQEGAKYLEKTYGGKGVLLSGVPGVDSGTVLVIGGGIVGTNAAKMACGMGARVYLLDTNLDRLRYLSDVMPKNCFALMSNPATIRSLLPKSDLVVGAVLIPGAMAPKLVTRDMLGLMKKGSVIVDVAIDQGGCVETAKPTTHDDPIYEVDGIIHYCVANMPGAVSMTSTIALTNATLPYALELADKGYKIAVRQNPDLAKGVNIIDGKVTYKGVAEAFGLEYTPLDAVL
ncbi:MAG: alanine dehydrogenase [Deltaproteobacteria bacterium]|nr:alanine dehydrogenase [Deltaproteobacteria bacterium]MBW1956012.1 alanine dehydrogenase [Deltaproteobacteria bacterium]MBW2042677.1 alanine dehydrogenase [Deltaproteobacteria bacterium]MBW2131453.1 alanine dehydrogenase [Deltaproteobacteria bacterium]